MADYEIDRAQLQALIRAAEADLAKVERALRSIQSGTNLSTADIGAWPAADQLVTISTRAHFGAASYGADLLRGYRDVIERLRTALRTYDEAEHKSTGRNRQAGAPIYR